MSEKQLREVVKSFLEAYDALVYLSFTKQGGAGDAVKVDGGSKKGIEVKMLSAFRLKGDIDRELRKIIKEIQDETFRIDLFLADLDEEWRGKDFAK